MASGYQSSNEVAISEGKAEMPAIQEMINDIRESTASLAQTSNTSLAAEDLLIQQAIALPSASENEGSTEETGNNRAQNTSESLVGALVSTGKRLSLALNNEASSDATESEETFSDTTPVDQVDQTQSHPVPPLAQATATTGTPKKKQHIMISYNRSCENDCRKIRNSLKGLKYKVWMDVYDMHDNFIEGMAKAIRNSYIVLICLNRKYDDSYWCRKEIEGVAIKRIKFIPCFMEEPFDLPDWLDFLVGGNIWIDFSKLDQFDVSFNKLIEEITCIEDKLATKPRETPTTTPAINPLTAMIFNPTVEESFNMIMRNFKTWVEVNRHDLQRFNRRQSSELIQQLLQGLRNDDTTLDEKNKKELLHQLLSSTSQHSNTFAPHFFNNFNTSNYPFMKYVLFIMALWAVTIVFKKFKFF